MESPTHETNGNHKNLDDLTQIRGIGMVRKRWLNSLGINTIANLAHASADAIEAQAKTDGRSLSRDELEEWIAQAQVLHVQASLKQEPSDQAAGAIASASDPQPRSGEQSDVTAEHVTAEHNPTDWETFASFKVDYQTRWMNGKPEQRFVAHHLETDEIASWSESETELMQQWLRDRIEGVLPSTLTSPVRMSPPVTAKITQLRVMQPHYMSYPMVADQNIPIFSDAIQTDEPFALEVSMQFAGLAEVNPAKQVAYRVQCLARNLETGITESLGDVTAHVSPSNDAVYKVLLPSLMLPRPGTYRLKVIVALQHAPAALGQFKVPMLQVV
jgi:hypothetical protein